MVLAASDSVSRFKQLLFKASELFDIWLPLSAMQTIT